MDITNLIVTLLCGAVAGWLASLVMGSKGGLLRNILMGIVGSFVGSFVFSFIHVTLPFSSLINSVLIAAVGACIVIFIGRLIFK
jgi:uncharacterized membrane protein YeaQ/YmgE (transglycosylase-associated protein family)